jgi:hypothetical protein
MEDNDGSKCNPTYINQWTNGTGVVAFFLGFEDDV